MWCSECRQADTAPRHHIMTAEGTLLTRHMDCCRDSGTCADGSCAGILEKAGGKKNDALAEFITSHEGPVL